MRSGISTACLYPMELEKALPTLLSMDFHLFEIFINTFSEMKPDYIANLKRMIDDTGSSVKSIHPFTSGFESFLLFTDYDRRFQDGLDFTNVILRRRIFWVRKYWFFMGSAAINGVVLPKSSILIIMAVCLN